MLPMFFEPPPLLLAAFPLQGLIAATLMIIAFIGWIINLINSQNHPPPPARRRRPAGERPRTVQDEIDQFLDEARQARQGQRSRAGAGEPQQPSIEVVEKRPARRPPLAEAQREQVWREQKSAGRKKGAKPASPAKPATPTQPAGSGTPPPPSPRPGESFAERRMGTLSTASDIRTHIEQQVADRIGARVQRDLVSTVSSSVASHLGRFTADDANSLAQQALAQTKVRQNQALSGIRKLLKSRTGVANIVIANEILSPPLSRRARRG